MARIGTDQISTCELTKPGWSVEVDGGRTAWAAETRTLFARVKERSRQGRDGKLRGFPGRGG